MRFVELKRDTGPVTHIDLATCVHQQETTGWAFAFMTHCPFEGKDRFMLAFRPRAVKDAPSAPAASSSPFGIGF